jgi:hypothetical protein
MHMGAAGEGSASRVYTAQQLRERTIPDLIDILKARGLPTTRGKKEELMQRILEAQQRSRKS